MRLPGCGTKSFPYLKCLAAIEEGRARPMVAPAESMYLVRPKENGAQGCCCKATMEYRKLPGANKSSSPSHVTYSALADSIPELIATERPRRSSLFTVRESIPSAGEASPPEGSTTTMLTAAAC